MKFWGISAAVCCLLADIFVGQHLYIKHRPAYTISTNRTDLMILWDNRPVVHGVASNMHVAVSPDGQSVAWVQERFYEHPDFLDDGDQPRTAYGILWTAHNGAKPIEVPAPKISRGASFEWDRRSPFTTWYPGGLQWDSTSRFLYFETPLCITRLALWQVTAGCSSPRYIESGGEHWLVKQWFGPDHVVIQGLRYEPPDFIKDYDHCFLYTPEEIARPKYVESEKQVRPPVKDWPQ